MITPQFSFTPLEENKLVTQLFNLDIDLRVKRDDLFPMPGGGIKSRKIEYIMKDLHENGHDMIVTNGGPQSNHARASALAAVEWKIPCHLVIVLEPGKTYPVTGNILMMKMAGAAIEYCTREELADRMDDAILHYKKMGYNPAYIWGGGHNVAGTEAFVDAALEAQKQSGGWIPDFLVLASGTGSTQAGLAIGYAGKKTVVVGVSVAREEVRGKKIVEDCVADYYKEKELKAGNVRIIFKDSWTFGGYEKADEKLYSMIHIAAKGGLILDPTYSGKGFYGLTEMVKSGEIPAGSKVLFWHTGGLMNLMGSSLSRDFITV